VDSLRIIFGFLPLRSLQGGGSSAAYNLGTGQEISVREVIARESTGRGIPIVHGPRWSVDPPRLVADASRARQSLGWEPRYPSLAASLSRAWRWHQDGFSEQA
jgi:UDP-glucose 4-epimerase